MIVNAMPEMLELSGCKCKNNYSIMQIYDLELLIIFCKYQFAIVFYKMKPQINNRKHSKVKLKL